MSSDVNTSKLDSFSTSTDCDNKRVIVQSKIDSIREAKSETNDLSTFEKSAYGLKLSALKAAVKDNACPELETIHIIDLSRIEDNLRYQYSTDVYNEQHKNDPVCEAPQLVSYSVEKNSDFKSFLLAKIKNNCNKPLVSLRVRLNFDKSNNNDELGFLNSCKQIRTIKTYIEPYKETEVSFRISNVDGCFDLNNPSITIWEYCRKNESARKTVEAQLAESNEKIQKKLGQRFGGSR